MPGWWGKIVRIDLSSKQWAVERPDIHIYEKFIGGRGLAGFYLKDHVNLDWNDPQIPLLLFTGPLVDTASPTSGRMTVMSRSPLTGTVGDCSVGGTLGTQLKKCGFDGLVITGRSDRLCGIEVLDGSVRFASAEHMAGLSIGKAGKLLDRKGASAVTGPAAENGVLFANVIVDGHYAAGRNGLGLVFASKNLKYITLKGSRKTQVYDSEELKLARDDVFRLTAASPALMGRFGLSRFGTGALYDLIDARCMMPTENFRSSQFPFAASMNAVAYEKRFHPQKTGCSGCHIRCKKMTENGSSVPEFETMSHFSALIGNRSLQAVMDANRICNEMGMDTISAGAVLACYAELSGRTLPPDDITGLLTDIGYGRGIGRKLGKGSARYADEMGRPEAAMTVKRQELPGYDPRGAYGMALAYAVSTRGACHLRAYPVSHEILRKPVATDRFTFEGKARIIKIGEDTNAVVDSLTVCKFVFFAASLEEYARVFSAVTGYALSGQELLKVGERIYFQERMMNAANGFDREADDLPERFFTSSGHCRLSAEIPPICRSDFLRARSNYYKVRGLDENGRPLECKIKELDL